MRYGERPDAFIDRGDVELDRAYQTAVGKLEKDQIDPREFEDLYGEENVRADLAYVDRRQLDFMEDRGAEDERARKCGTILEGVLYSEIELNQWLGEDAFTIRPSRYDDVKHGIDVIVEFRKPERAASYLGLGIDATIAKDERDLRRDIIIPKLSQKITKIKEKIRDKKLPSVKYFASDHTDIRGEQRNVPLVLVTTDFKTIKELAELYLTRNNEALARHPLQIRMLDEMHMELKAFRNYAHAVQNYTAERVYSERLEIIERILKEKEPLRQELIADGTLNEEHDAGFQALSQLLKEHFPPDRDTGE